MTKNVRVKFIAHDELL